jgi:N-methylhydantoinase B
VGGTTSYSFGGYDREGRFVHFREAVMGNWGGGFGREGLDGVANPAANISNAPVEVVEQHAPIVVERYELEPDSGGAGQWRGGLAVLRQLRFLGESATLQLRSDRRAHPPFGLLGGRPGAPSRTHLRDDGGEWRLLPTKFTMPIRQGQAIRHVTAGAGGYGDPLERDPARVRLDVANGKVSPEAAERDYGVRLTGPPWRVDAEATASLRAARRGGHAS